MSMSHFLIKDIDGRTRIIKKDEITKLVITEGGTIFGMSFEVVGQLRTEYMRRGGPMPMTVESVRKVFAD